MKHYFYEIPVLKRFRHHIFLKASSSGIKQTCVREANVAYEINPIAP